MAEKHVTIKEFDGQDYNEIYPKTTPSQVLNLEEQISSWGFGKIIIGSYKGTAPASTVFTRKIDVGIPFKGVLLLKPSSSGSDTWNGTSLWFLSELNPYNNTQNYEKVEIDSDKRGFTISRSTAPNYNSVWNNINISKYIYIVFS